VGLCVLGGRSVCICGRCRLAHSTSFSLTGYKKDTKGEGGFRKTRFYFKHGVEGVWAGTKTMTRRRLYGWGKKYTACIISRMLTGSWIRAQTNYATATQFGWIKITNMYIERLGDMPRSDVVKEGFPNYSLSQFKGIQCFKGCCDHDWMWVVVFHFHGLFE
jgi:hypothetical protein